MRPQGISVFPRHACSLSYKLNIFPIRCLTKRFRRVHIYLPFRRHHPLHGSPHLGQIRWRLETVFVYIKDQCKICDSWAHIHYEVSSTHRLHIKESLDSTSVACILLLRPNPASNVCPTESSLRFSTLVYHSEEQWKGSNEQRFSCSLSYWIKVLPE